MNNSSIVTLNAINYYMVDVKNESIWDFVEAIKANDESVIGYSVLKNIGYFSKRYGKWICVDKKDLSDGATGAMDIDSFGWIFHDELCSTGVFNNGTVCNNWQASHILTDIMKEEGYWFRTRTWFWATWLGGGGKARDNGLF